MEMSFLHFARAAYVCHDVVRQAHYEQIGMLERYRFRQCRIRGDGSG